ncbi:transposase [Streptomyces sp. NBC_00842]|uniref:IS110 family transposase n=1 Tax=unclassified Streptomyces TaxID=2593676 RepID=UPI00386DAF77
MYDELTEVAVPEIWAGVDIGKEHHHCVVIDAQGKRLLSRRILNDEAELLQLIADVLELSRGVLWAVDINHGGAALLLGLLVSHDQHITYTRGGTADPGRGGRCSDRQRPAVRGRAPSAAVAGGQQRADA